MSGSEKDERKPDPAFENPQLTRLRTLTKKSKPRSKTPRSKRRNALQKMAYQARMEELWKGENAQQQQPIRLSAEDAIEHVMADIRTAQKEPSSQELGPPNGEKSSIWSDTRESELERRLEKLNKALLEIKDDKIRRLRESVREWEEKYDRRLYELEMAMRRYEQRCKIERAEVNDQLSRVEEMSDANVVTRQRIEKKLVLHGPNLQSESNRRFLTVVVNIVRGILYYTAQIRDALWAPRVAKIEGSPLSASSSEENVAIVDMKR